MNRTLPFALGLALFAAGCDSKTADAGGATTSAPPVSFPAVQAVMTAKCVGCHGAGRPRGGVNLTTLDAILKGGEHGPIVKPGDPAGSELVAVMKGAPGHKRMPPNGEPASAEQIKTVEDWIQSGAKGS